MPVERQDAELHGGGAPVPQGPQRPAGATLVALALLAALAVVLWLSGAPLLDGQGLVAMLSLALVAALAAFARQRVELLAHRRSVLARRGNEELLRQAAMVFDHTRDGVMITDAQARIQAVNPAFTQITGYAEEEAIGRSPALLQSGRQDAAFYRALWATLLKTGSWQGEVWNRRKDGDVYPEWLTISAVRPHQGAEPTHYVGVFTDVSRIRRSESQLERLAHYDPLTELPNRRLLQQRLEQALERSRRHGHRVALLYLDLDGFKTVNDTLGHPAGDLLLTTVAKRLKTRLRDEDTLGRLGGDEFLVVLENVADGEAAAVVARDLLAAVAEPSELLGRTEAWVTASIGIGLHPGDGGDATELLRNADIAMYRAKDQGRNRFCFYTRDMNADVVHRFEVEAALRRALERDELVLHYQPKVEAMSGAIVGVEALVRWQRPGVGLLAPDEFVPLAEKSSLIVGLGNWVIDRACRQLRGWLDQGLPVVPVAINVSARQLAAGDFDAVLRDALRRYGLSARMLEVELTESVLVERPAEAAAAIAKLKALGLKVSLDDFGTGASSLAHLRRFRIDTLKVDRSFVHGIDADPEGTMIVDAIIDLAHRMSVKVVAEGVETAAQNAHLKRRGCDEIQGFHYSRPLAADKLQRLLAAVPAQPLGEQPVCAALD